MSMPCSKLPGGLSKPNRILSNALFLLALTLAASSVCSAQAIRLLAFGDSLTQGLTDSSTRFHPYATRLQQLLTAHDPRIKVVEKGISGERVLVTMVQRLQTELQQAESEGSRYSWVLLLAGINDIGNGAGAQHVFHGLLNMYKACTQHGARVLAMTCMENFGSGLTLWDKHRMQLNAHIREYCMKHAGPRGALLVDLDKLIPFRNATEAQRNATFDDGLHLTPQGYDRMGEIIFQAMKPIL